MMGAATLVEENKKETRPQLLDDIIYIYEYKREGGIELVS
jgi:hypothetical protein